jgi:hypothetical protein
MDTVIKNTLLLMKIGGLIYGYEGTEGSYTTRLNVQGYNNLGSANND